MAALGVRLVGMKIDKMEIMEMGYAKITDAYLVYTALQPTELSLIQAYVPKNSSDTYLKLHHLTPVGVKISNKIIPMVDMYHPIYYEHIVANSPMKVYEKSWPANAAVTMAKGDLLAIQSDGGSTGQFAVRTIGLNLYGIVGNPAQRRLNIAVGDNLRG